MTTITTVVPPRPRPQVDVHKLMQAMSFDIEEMEAEGVSQFWTLTLRLRQSLLHRAVQELVAR
jgi:hypothetical protein